MRQPADRLSNTLAYEFTDRELLDVALTHRSAGGSHNERLEFLGDTILGFVIAEALYGRFPDADEGQLSRLRAGLVRRDSLAPLARGLQLGQYLQLGPGESRSGGQSRDSILADALEALFAAIYLDGGLQSVRRVVLALFRARIDELAAKKMVPKDPKTQLQEHLQAHKLELPEYRVLEVSGEQHSQLFSVRCSLPGLGLQSTGTGSSRRRAEQQAARRLLDEMRNA